MISTALATAAATAGGESFAAAPTRFTVGDADLFAALDFVANMALAPVQKAWATGDVPGAKKALADYLRSRTSVPWDISPHVADRAAIVWDEKAAAAAMRGDVVVVAIPHAFPNAEIDWFYNPTGGTSGLPSNEEWLWQLNRLAWWNDLVHAYQATGDEKYATAWVQQLRSWAAHCPPPEKVRNAPGSAWRTIECGIRGAGILPLVYQAFLLSPSVTDDDLLTLVKVMVEHGEYLNAFHSGGNWLTMEMNGLYAVGALFPELRDAAAWRKKGADTLHGQQSAQFLPDGAQFELSPGYHNTALRNILGIYQRAVLTSRTGELPKGYVEGMERAFNYDLYMSTPDRSLPKFNDSGAVDVPNYMRIASALFPARADIAYLATDGKQGTVPPTLSHAFDYAGYYVMREDWGSDACMGVLDAGPLGNGHYHQDKLNFILWSHGRELLFDSGGGNYELSPYRGYATSTFGHNCVLVDGKPQRRDVKDVRERVSKTPIDAKWETTDSHDYAEGTYTEGWGTVTDRVATHRRRVLFVKATAALPAFFVVSDLLTPADSVSHTYQARWNLLTVKTTADPATLATVTTDAGLPNVVVVPLRTAALKVQSASAQTNPEILGWDIRREQSPQYVPATTLLHNVEGAGPQRFLTLFVPTKAGVANPVQGVEAGAGGNPFVVRLAGGGTLRIDDGEDRLSAGAV